MPPPAPPVLAELLASEEVEPLPPPAAELDDVTSTEPPAPLVVGAQA
jgi:hypothetical protein